MKDNIMSELELTETGGRYQNETKNISERNEDKEENGVKEKENVSVLEKVKNFFKILTVEPFLLFLLLPSAIVATTIQKIYLDKACRTELNFTEEICALILSGNVTSDDNITSAAMNDAQRLSTGVKEWSQPLQSGIPAIIILFIGAWSDRTGNRKLLILVPIIGEFISCVGLLLATYFFLEWPLWVTALVMVLPTSFMGGTSVAIMGAYSYIADVTTVESRTVRIGVLVVIVMLGWPLGYFIGGGLTKKIGYYGIFGIAAVIYVLTFFMAYFKVHDVKRVPMQGTFGEKLKDFFQLKHAWETISFLFMSSRSQLIQIILVIGINIVMTGPAHGESAILYEYSLKKYNIDEEELSYFNMYSILVGAADGKRPDRLTLIPWKRGKALVCGAICVDILAASHLRETSVRAGAASEAAKVRNSVALLVFNKVLKMHDASIGVIDIISKVMASFVYSLGPTKTWYYVAPIVNLFGNSGTSIIKSLGTKIVDPDKVGRMVSLISFVESIMPSIYTPIFAAVYKKTLQSFSGASFLLGGLMRVPAFFMFIYLYVIQKRQERDRVQNPDEKERHAHENQATVL